MSIKILSRWSGAVLCSSETANTIVAAVLEAISLKANLSGANLRDAKNFVMQIQGSRHEMVAIDDDIRIGCQRNALATWLAVFASVGKVHGYTPYEIDEYGDHLRYIERRLDRLAQ